MPNSDFEKCAFCVLFVTFLLLIFFDNYYNKKSIQENMPSYLASPGMTLGTQADNPSVWRNIPNNKPLMMKKLKKDKKQYDFREHYQCRPQERIPEINEMEDQDIKYESDSSDCDNELVFNNYFDYYGEREKSRKPRKYHRKQTKKQYNVEPVREIYNPEPMSDRPDLNNCVPCKPCKPCKC